MLKFQTGWERKKQYKANIVNQICQERKRNKP